MRKIQVRIAIRLTAGVAALVAFALVPQLAQAQTEGALTQLGGPNSCISAPVESECPTLTGDGLTETNGVVVSPNGQNVYAIGEQDQAIAEFTRNSDGSLTYLGCIADASSDGTCDNATATGLVGPEAIAISPDGKNVYVGAEDTHGVGDIAEFAVSPNGSLTQLGTPNGCIAENPGQAPAEASDCTGENTQETGPIGNQTGHGIRFPDALAVSSDGTSVYAGDENGEALAELTRASDGSLSQPDGAADCIRDISLSSDGADCTPDAAGVADVTGIALSPDPGNDNVYTAGESAGDSNASIAEFTRDPDTGLLTPAGCLGTDGEEECGSARGLVGLTGIVVSPDGNNVYTASEQNTGPIAEFSRGGDNGTLEQLTTPNDCIEEQGSGFGCGSNGIGIEDGYSVVMSPDGTDLYAAGSTVDCGDAGTCSDVAEFTRDTTKGGALVTPNSCIQDESVEGSECPGNENGLGLGGPSLAISPDGNNVYVTGTDDIAEFARGTHTLTVSLAGSGTGAVGDGSGAISCPSSCSNPYTTDSTVTLTASPSSGSTFTGWSGAGCSGTGTCQVLMNADTTVTATFTSTAAPSPGSPTPVLTGAPTAVTDGGAGFSGSVNPDGLPTTAYFQYGLDKRYSQLGASGPDYTDQTQPQTVGSDFASHDVGPVTITGLVPNALYHVRLVATNSSGTTFGQDVTFTTAAAPAPGTPTLGQTFNIQPVSGLVFVYVNGHLVPLTQLTQIPAGVAIDTRQGTLKLTTATGGGGGAHDASLKTQTGEFSGAVFRLNQQTRGAGKGLVTLMLTLSAFNGAPSQATCKPDGAAADAHAANTNSKVIQLLHASAHGKFRTSGRYSAATVLGTIWTVSARCDGTLTHAIKDEVEVTDFVRHKTIVLHAGQSYLAPGPRKHK